jgi:hypothetical protein
VQRGPLAWVDGAAEIGPRALGHRSILADPRTPASRDALNRCKGRQWWRPVAPIVLAEEAADWFEIDRPSPYMLETAAVRPDAVSRVPAIAHLDGTARLQTLTAAADPQLYAAIAAFHRATGVPVLCNTSLNDKGEPIVNTAAEALTFCVRKGLTVAYVEGRRIALRPAELVSTPPPPGPRPRRLAAFTGQESTRDRIWHEWLGAGYSVEALYLITHNPGLRAALRNQPDPRRANRLAVLARNEDARFPTAVSRFLAAYAPPVELMLSSSSSDLEL